MLMIYDGLKLCKLVLIMANLDFVAANLLKNRIEKDEKHERLFPDHVVHPSDGQLPEEGEEDEESEVE